MSQVYTSGLLSSSLQSLGSGISIPFGGPGNANKALIGSLSVPPGKYVVLVTTVFVNHANFIAQDNSRNVICEFFGTWYGVALDGFGDGAWYGDLAMQRVAEFTAPTTIEVLCWVPSNTTDDSRMKAYDTVITAIKVDTVN